MRACLGLRAGTRAQAGAGAAARIRPSLFRSAHKPAGMRTAKISALRRTSSGLYAPGMTETTAGCPKG